MSNKLPNAREYLSANDIYTDEVINIHDVKLKISDFMQGYSNLQNEALKEENERLHDKLIDLQALLLGLLDGNLCSAAGDDVIKQALNKEG